MTTASIVETHMIKCAHCKGRHPSVADVRFCAAFDNAAKAEAEVKAPVPAARPAYVTNRENLRKAVPEGHYALEIEGTWKFYRVTKPTEGRWMGWTFVDQQAGSEYFPVKPSTQVLTLIAADPKAAMVAYGHHIGECGYCGRPLTKPESRLRGIGPVCAKRLGF